MKTTILKSVMTVLVALISLNANAYDVYIDGIYYNLVKKTKTAEVTYGEKKSGTYSGKVMIPASIEKDGVTYSVTSIGSSAFYYCKGLTSVTIPNSVTSIGHEAFQGCSSLISVTIPSSVMTIGQYAFYYCYNLTFIHITDLVAWCQIKKDYTIFDNSIPHLYLNGNEVKDLVIPKSITSIGNLAFSHFSGLTSVAIPESVTSIGNGAFQNCSGLTSVTIPNSVTSIGDGAFRNCSGLTSVTIPNSVTSIGESCFNGCAGLTSIRISESITTIKSSVFRRCSGLTSISIPYSVKEMGDYAFSECSELTDVYCYANVVPKKTYYETGYNNAFKDSFIEYATLHVPESSIDAYKSQEPWSGFGKIVAIKPFHTLTYVVDGETYKTFEIEEGEPITAEEKLSKEGYSFSGWEGLPETMPANDVTVTGSFIPNKYTLTYMVDGMIYKSSQVEYETAITPEAEPTKEGYTFSGWSEIPATMPSKDVTVTGGFTVNKYTLTYMVDDEAIKAYEVEYGMTITPEAEPTKEGYTFSGWSSIPETMPANDVTVTGSFTINKYTLSYTVNDETYKTYEVTYGNSITAETEPTKEGYTFSGWSEIPATMPAHDVTITGRFTRIPPVASYKRNLSSQTTGMSSMIVGSYVRKSVGFNLVNKGSESIYVKEVVVKNASNYAVVSRSTDTSLLGTLEGGNSIALSVNLTSDIMTCYEWHYTYNGKDFVFCSDASDPAMKHDVTFYVDDNVLVTYEYDTDDEISPEEEPTKEGYTFSGWSEIPATMPNKDVTVKGTFTANIYTLTYEVDGEAVKTSNVEYETAIKEDMKPQKGGYTFVAEDEVPSTMPANDVTIKGAFTVNKYTLIYVVDEETIKTYEVEYGTAITAEAEPIKEGYTFSGWSAIPATMPANDVTVTGSFIINKYTLTYMVDGEEYKAYEVEYGTDIKAEIEPTKEGYTFSGWSEVPGVMPANDVTVTGMFAINKYTLTYKVNDEIYKTYEVEFGTTITAEEEPTKEGYTFSGWSAIPATMPAENVTVTGDFTFIDAIEDVIADDDEYQIFTLDGKNVESLQKGVNIIRYSNGTTKSVYVK